VVRGAAKMSEKPRKTLGETAPGGGTSRVVLINP